MSEVQSIDGDRLLCDAEGGKLTQIGVMGKLVDGIFNQWSLLHMAIEMEFAGNNSKGKAIEMYDEVMDIISRKGKKVDIDDLEDMLDEYIQIDFNCTAEDGSQRVVAELIFEAISKVDAGDMEWIKKTAIEYEQKLQKKTESGKRVEYFVDDALEAQRAKLASAAAEAKAAETAAARAEEEAAMEEDDGWTTVKKR